MSQYQILSNTTKILGGSAVAGFGLSFGRDVYKGTKKKTLLVIAISIFLLSIFGTFISGVWLTRNYRYIYSSIFSRIGGLLIAFISSISCSICVFTIIQFANIYGLGVQQYFIIDPNPVLKLINEYGFLSDTVKLIITIFFSVYGFSFTTIIFFIGLIVGYSQRSKRKRLWEAEVANEEFMQANNLHEYEDGTIEDRANEQNFRVDHLGSDRITLFPLGKRGKRAYIYIDSNGHFSKYSGIVKL